MTACCTVEGSKVYDSELLRLQCDLALLLRMDAYETVDSFENGDARSTHMLMFMLSTAVRERRNQCVTCRVSVDMP